MDQPTRMFRTLGCLVAAMTGAAAWLGWMDPSAPLASELTSVDAVLRQTHSLVVDGVAIHKGQWDSVDIVAGPSRAAGTMLAAQADHREIHFQVDLAGRASRTARWQRQQAPVVGQGTVVIAVARDSARPGISRAQWRCLGGLLAALRESASATNHLDAPDNTLDDSNAPAFPVRVHAEWARVYGLEPGTIVEIPSPAGSVG